MYYAEVLCRINISLTEDSRAPTGKFNSILPSPLHPGLMLESNFTHHLDCTRNENTSDVREDPFHQSIDHCANVTSIQLSDNATLEDWKYLSPHIMNEQLNLRQRVQYLPASVNSIEKAIDEKAVPGATKYNYYLDCALELTNSLRISVITCEMGNNWNHDFGILSSIYQFRYIEGHWT
jgi:hypothetical protein